jgi:GTP-binding protein
VHVLDMATMEPGRDPVSDLDVVEHELASYGGLEDRPRLVALNKIDVPDGREMADLVVDELRARGLTVIPVSAASHEGLPELSFAMARVVRDARAARPVAEAARIILRPQAADDGPDFSVARTDDGWRVRGLKPERWVRQTDFSNDEAVGFLADRLNRLGVEDRLLELGAVEGDAVVIGPEDDSVVFDFKPMVDAGASVLGSRRGEDARLEEQRPAVRRRRAIDAAYGERAEGEARADVARRTAAGTEESDASGQGWDQESAWNEEDPHEEVR